jgi:hypothetical protein
MLGRTWQRQQQQGRMVDVQPAACNYIHQLLTLVVVQAVSAKDALIAQLQQQLEQQAATIAASTGDHDNNMAKLIKSINEMQQSCQAQVRLSLLTNTQ